MSSGAEILYEPSGCNCGGRTSYTKNDINVAAATALQLAQEGRTLGRDRYPHVYNDYEHFEFSHAQKPYLEFPIQKNGHAYDGEAPGADRVVIGSIAEDYQSAVYCAVITHSGAKKNGFTECADDTMNIRGLGDFAVGQNKIVLHQGRKLLDRIELKD